MRVGKFSAKKQRKLRVKSAGMRMARQKAPENTCKNAYVCGYCAKKQRELRVKKRAHVNIVPISNGNCV